MKNLILVTLLFISINLNAQHTAAWKLATRNPDGSVGLPALNSGDTLNIDGSLGTYTYLYIGNRDFNPAIVIKPINATVNMTSGFSLDNMKGWHVTGTGVVGVTYGINIRGANVQGGVGFSIFNLGERGEIDHVEVSHIMGWIWLKDEQKCSLNYANGFFHYRFHHNYMHNCGLDGMYLGSSDPYGTARTITCGGVVTHPRPARLGDIRVDSNLLDSTNRQIVQINNCDTLGAFVIGNTMKHAGFGRESNQGVGFFAGQGTKDVTITGNTIISCWQHCIWTYGYGMNIVKNNICDSSGFIFGVANYAESPFMISGVPNAGRANFDIENNFFSGASSDPQGYGVAIDNSGAANILNTGNTLCNSGTVYNPQSVAYSTSCSGTPHDTVITIHVIHDTVETTTVTRKINYDSVVVGKDTTIKTAMSITPNGKLKNAFDKRMLVTFTYHLQRDTTYDSTFNCKLCASHDSSYIIQVVMNDFEDYQNKSELPLLAWEQNIYTNKDLKKDE